MNTCLSTIYLTISKFDSRHIRMALMFLTLIGAGFGILGIPIHGDVGS